jgi:hypothetical protein
MDLTARKRGRPGKQGLGSLRRLQCAVERGGVATSWKARTQQPVDQTTAGDLVADREREGAPSEQTA